MFIDFLQLSTGRSELFFSTFKSSLIKNSNLLNNIFDIKHKTAYSAIFVRKFVMPYRKEDALQFGAIVLPCRAN